MTPAWTAEVLEPGFLSGLDRLALARRRLGQGAAGMHASRARRASGLDWVDYRAYAPGDEVRYVNWPLYTRTDKPYVRSFCAEKSDRLEILVDCSRSMSLGQPAKIDVARALAFAFGYVVLAAGGRVGLACFAETMLGRIAAGSGPAQQARLLEFLSLAPLGGRTDLRTSLAGFAERTRELGEVVVLSDLLDDESEAGLGSLVERGFRVSLLRLRAGCDERVEQADETFTVMDVETGKRRRVALGSAERERYLDERRRDRQRTEEFCSRAGITLASLGTEQRLTDLVFNELRRPGLLG